MMIRDLVPGTRFCAGWNPNLVGTLIRLGPGSAYVEVQRPSEREFTTGDGKLVKFSTATERTTWSLETDVQPLR